jgi:hemerythrin-like domain-containing protein
VPESKYRSFLGSYWKDERVKLQGVLAQFIGMYRPHAAREDTVLFSALHSIVSSHEYDSMGEQFEDEEYKLFGADGFEKLVDEVAGLERKMGLRIWRSLLLLREGDRCQ